MRPFSIRSGPSPTLADFDVRWSELVVGVESLHQARYPYLRALAKHCNRGGIPDGILALSFDLATDPEAGRLLTVAYQFPKQLQAALAARFLSMSRAAGALTAYEVDSSALEASVEAAAFQYISPFHLEGTLAEDLFYYGMYHRFCDDRSAEDARSLARGFLHDTVGEELEPVIPLTTRLPWGAWFDPHSCTDRSWLIFGRSKKRALLMTLSHSD